MTTSSTASRWLFTTAATTIRTASYAWTALLAAFAFACDSPARDVVPSAVEAGASPSPAIAAGVEPQQPERAPDIIVDRSSIAVGNDRVPTGEPSLAQSVAALLNEKPGIAGHAVDLVAMRNASPSQVAAVVGVLRAAKASSVTIKTTARDDTTQKLPVSFPSSLAECAIVAWIAKDGIIDVWPAGGGATKRVARGLAGPDMTLGTDSIRAQWAGCGAPTMAIGAEETMTWGLVFDLGTSALQAPGSRTSTVTLITAATPGRKVVLP